MRKDQVQMLHVTHTRTRTHARYVIARRVHAGITVSFSSLAICRLGYTKKSDSFSLTARSLRVQTFPPSILHLHHPLLEVYVHYYHLVLIDAAPGRQEKRGKNQLLIIARSRYPSSCIDRLVPLPLCYREIRRLSL